MALISRLCSRNRRIGFQNPRLPAGAEQAPIEALRQQWRSVDRDLRYRQIQQEIRLGCTGDGEHQRHISVAGNEAEAERRASPRAMEQQRRHGLEPEIQGERRRRIPQHQSRKNAAGQQQRRMAAGRDEKTSY